MSSDDADVHEAICELKGVQSSFLFLLSVAAANSSSERFAVNDVVVAVIQPEQNHRPTIS